MFLFDPSRWPRRELLARVCGCLAVGAFLVRRVFQLKLFPGIIAEVDWLERLPGQAFHLARFYRGYSPVQIRLLWSLRLAVCLIESGILIGYIVAFLTRDRAKAIAKGFMEVAFPLVMGGLPFLIVMTRYTFEISMPAPKRHLLELGGIFLLLISGGALNLVGLFTLRRAFTIMTEARTLVRRGVYRFVRHPLYAGHFVIYFGYTLLHFHWYTIAIYVALIVGQTVRARIEERKLTLAFPEYAEYRRTTGMFFPRPAPATRAPASPPR